MRDEYKLKGKTEAVEVQIESEVAKNLSKMESHSQLSRSEIVNTALKRFIASHKDFLPGDARYEVD
jgi:metal-responsive CopG/Arc/MetJ family transcriptional regulator